MVGDGVVADPDLPGTDYRPHTRREGPGTSRIGRRRGEPEHRTFHGGAAERTPGRLDRLDDAIVSLSLAADPGDFDDLGIVRPRRPDGGLPAVDRQHAA